MSISEIKPAELIPIVDVREQCDFSRITFSGYKITEVKNELKTAIINCKIDEALYWSIEYICSGHFLELWEFILNYYSNYINIANIKFAIYLDLKIEEFKKIIEIAYGANILPLRNNEKIRKIFCEIIVILCISKKNHSTYEIIKINKTDFDLTQLTDRFKAPNVNFYKDVFKDEDPKEIIIAVNELVYNISIKNSALCFYWIEWIIELNNIKSKSNSTKIIGARRDTIFKKNDNNQLNIIWIIWEIILIETHKKQSKILTKIITSLLNLFCFHFTKPSIKKHKYFIYISISLLLDNIYITNASIIEDKTRLDLFLRQINSIYKQIKNNEKNPKTDYLYTNVKKSNLDKSIKKLEKMNEFNEKFIPRTENIDEVKI
jgi:hypothetical protein